jgi:hypothetical protein
LGIVLGFLTCESALKGLGFSRAVSAPKSTPAFKAAEGALSLQCHFFRKPVQSLLKNLSRGPGFWVAQRFQRCDKGALL